MFARIPKPPYVTATLRVRASMPPFVNSYAAWSTKLDRPWIDPTFTIAPGWP
nr:hypothetical protein [Microbacterium barkeri]